MSVCPIPKSKPEALKKRGGMTAPFLVCRWMSIVHIQTSLIATKNPNPFPIGIRFGFFKYGGRYKTRTCDLPHVKRMRYQLRQSSICLSAKAILPQLRENVKFFLSNNGKK